MARGGVLHRVGVGRRAVARVHRAGGAGIGNAEYAEAAARLTNPVRDARAICAEPVRLVRCGWQRRGVGKDCWHDDYSGAPSDGKAWLGRGSAAGYRYNYAGFRVSRTLD